MTELKTATPQANLRKPIEKLLPTYDQRCCHKASFFSLASVHIYCSTAFINIFNIITFNVVRDTVDS